MFTWYISMSRVVREWYIKWKASSVRTIIHFRSMTTVLLFLSCCLYLGGKFLWNVVGPNNVAGASFDTCNTDRIRVRSVLFFLFLFFYKNHVYEIIFWSCFHWIFLVIGKGTGPIAFIDGKKISLGTQYQLSGSWF